MDYTPNDPVASAPPLDPPPFTPSATVGGMSQNMAAALAYVTFIPAVIFLMTEPYNKNAFVRFHSIQSIALFVVWVVCFIAQMVLMFIPILGFLIGLVIGLGMLVTWIVTVLKASQGAWFKLPVIGDIAMTKSKE